MILFQASESLNYTPVGIAMFDGVPNITSTIFTTVFAMNFWLTSASTIYVYCGEILTDKGMAIATAVHWFLNAFVEFMPIGAFRIAELLGTWIRFHDANSIFFFIFGGISMASFFLITIFVKETINKTRSQISDLYGHSNYHSMTSTVSSTTSSKQL